MQCLQVTRCHSEDPPVDASRDPTRPIGTVEDVLAIECLQSLRPDRLVHSSDAWLLWEEDACWSCVAAWSSRLIVNAQNLVVGDCHLADLDPELIWQVEEPEHVVNVLRACQ